VIDESKIDTSTVQILTKVRVKNKNNGQEKVYQLVAESEANFLQGKISITTPIAKGLLGKKVGEVAKIAVPAGTLELEILEITI